jgi:hypothetical protein
MGETNSPSVGHVGYDISPLSRVNWIAYFSTAGSAGLKRRNNGRNCYKQQDNEDMRNISPGN